MSIKKILIANRGEIAVRIIRTCRELSIPTVAIFSEVDRASLHVQLADEAVCIGPAASSQSYLNMDRIIAVAKELGADAIHPGYGFLAENHEFAKRCENEGIIFIGPNSKALRLVGDKVESRDTMVQAGIPIIPGMMHKEAEVTQFKVEAERIGYPVLIKASAGGGGKGMRIVRSVTELPSALEAGRREAKSAFGDESIYLEKYIEEPRHVEFQVLADHFGNAVHLFERECSIQRRHQKIVEETPSPALDDDLRRRMGAAAIKAIKAAGYSNAGTVEFLLDKNGSFYFLEVNARIQVEHPITELTTGVDLVRQQIGLASGKELRLQQDELQQRGHAIECRIYAEDPANNFLPSPGKILFLKEPSGPGIRNDSGIYGGWEVPVHYDPILAKLIAWAEDREVARRKILAALCDYVILGITTAIPFLVELVNHPAFIAGHTHTHFIERNMAHWQAGKEEKRLLNEALVAAAVHAFQKKSVVRPVFSRNQVPTPWQTVGQWEIASGN